MRPSIEGSRGTREHTDGGSPTDVTILVGGSDDEVPHAVGQTDATRRIGRYLVVEQIGAGGMGRVLRAYDPKLRREVALKLLSAGREESEGAARIVREAQAMARLSHPNLVPVFDVELDGEDAFIAMEYVEGDTLRTWLDRAPRRWQEIVGAFMGAGRGLAAAHAAGVVHRDFKPSNAMVVVDPHGDGEVRVRVMDFGLARGISTVDRSHDGPSVEVAALSEVTQAGAIVGTPPYMAPEQHVGGAVEPASDQYAFCVALYEALYGIRPFEGPDVDTLVRAKRRGVPAAPRAKGVLVPPWLRAVVVRGLAPRAEDRWPSMLALLAALERGQARARTRKWLAAAGAIALAGGAVVLVRNFDARQRQRACAEAGATIEAVWNDQARTGLQEALLASGASFAGTTATNVTPWFDEHADAWRRARTQVCVAQDIDRTWDRETVERALWCLAERRMQLEALVEALSTGGADAAKRAVAAVASLPRAQACVDVALLSRLPPPPIERREDVTLVRDDLLRAEALDRTGRYVEGLTLARATRERAEALGWPPMTAAASLREAVLLERLNDYPAAERAATDAYFLAADVGEWDVAARAASRVAVVVGTAQARRDQGLEWARHAAVAGTYAGEGDGLREASRLNAAASVHNRAGEHAQARELHERALEIQLAALGPDHPQLAPTYNNLANVVQSLGDFASARTLHARALAISEQTLGPEHPDVAVGLSNIALADYAAGNFTEARALNERALAIRKRALGPKHAEVGASLSNLGNIYQGLGDYAEARALYQQAVDVWEAALGPEHPDLAGSLGNLAASHYWLGDYAEARALNLRALAIHEKTLGPEHPYVAFELMNLALVENATGHSAEARALLERALALREKAFGPEHPELGAVLGSLGHTMSLLGEHAKARALFERGMQVVEKGYGTDHLVFAQALSLFAEALARAGEHDEALPRFERAMAIFDRDPRMTEGEVAARFAFAKCLRASGGDQKRARALAEQARDRWRSNGEGGGRRAAEAEAFLAEGDAGRRSAD